MEYICLMFASTVKFSVYVYSKILEPAFLILPPSMSIVLYFFDPKPNKAWRFIEL